MGLNGCIFADRRLASFRSYTRGRLLDLVDPAKGSLAPGEAGGVQSAKGLGEEGGEESTGASEGDDEGEAEKRSDSDIPWFV